MKRFTIILSIIALVLIGGSIILWALYPKQTLAIEPVNSVESMEIYFDRITEEEFPPSMNVSVMKDGQLVYDKGFGDNVSPDNAYAYWSVTKVYTAAAVLRLTEDGIVDLDAPISDYLPDYGPVDKDGNPVVITVRHLLEHRSGVKDLQGEIVQLIHLHGQEGMGVTKVYDDYIKDKYARVANEPGTQVKYTNTAYILLATMIEAVTDGTYADYVQEHVLDAADLEKTSFRLEGDILAKAVQPSNPVFNHFTLLLRLFADKDFNEEYVLKTENGRHWFRHFYTEYKGSTGLFGTASDLAAFGQVLMEDYSLEAGEAGELLSSSSAASMFGSHDTDTLTDSIKNDDFAVGLKTWRLGDKIAYGHAGGGAGYGAALAIMPEEDLVIAILANDTNIDRDHILEVVAGLDW